MLTLETWKALFAFDLLLTFSEEVVIGVLEAFNGVLERLRAYLFEPRQFLFQCWEFGFIQLTSQPLAFGFVCSDPLGEEIVEDETAAPEMLVEKHILFGCWVQSKLVSIQMLQLTPWGS